MRYRNIGSSDLTVSIVGLGCNEVGHSLDAMRTRVIIDAALDCGITLLDTADIYGHPVRGASESYLGQALQGRRDKVVLATKFGFSATSMSFGPATSAPGGRAYIRRALEESLRRLQTDYIDLYQLHTPDPLTPIGETLNALSDLVREGKIRYIGHSNFPAWQIAEAAHIAREIGSVPFISAQNRWSLLDRAAEKEVVPAAAHYGLGVLPCYPLAKGLLTGKIRRGRQIPDGSWFTRHPGPSAAVLDEVERMADWAETRGHTLLELAIGALAERPGCASVIAGATTPEQVCANAAAASAWVPTPKELDDVQLMLDMGRLSA